MVEVFKNSKQFNCPLVVSIIRVYLSLLGAYAEWINHHPVALRDVMPLLLMGLDCAEVATSATMALKDLTRDCQPSIAPFCSSILHAAKVNSCKISEYYNMNIYNSFPIRTLLIVNSISASFGFRPSKSK